MIITKEHQEAMVRNYAKQGKSSEQVIGFIDGLYEMVNLVTKKSIDELKKSN